MSCIHLSKYKKNHDEWFCVYPTQKWQLRNGQQKSQHLAWATTDGLWLPKGHSSPGVDQAMLWTKALKRCSSGVEMGQSVSTSWDKGYLEAEVLLCVVPPHPMEEPPCREHDWLWHQSEKGWWWVWALDLQRVNSQIPEGAEAWGCGMIQDLGTIWVMLWSSDVLNQEVCSVCRAARCWASRKRVTSCQWMRFGRGCHWPRCQLECRGVPFEHLCGWKASSSPSH